MTPASCPRLFEAEAMRDGRLAGAELASFARHTAGCSTCRREIQTLEQLADALRASPPRADVDELHDLRERTRLIATFDRTLVSSRPRAGVRGKMIWATGAAALMAAALLVLWRVRPPRELPSPGAVVVQASSDAIWSRRVDGNREKVTLDRGTVWIHVDHSQREPGLTVVLPDGELEDTGTTFEVSAGDRHTTRVAVHDGSVVLRIHGHPPVSISGGGTWAPEPRRSPVASPAPAVAESAPRRPVLARRSPAPEDPALEFRAAVAVLDVGANRDAAAAFTAFLAKHPRDARAEDAAYLRVIALQRCGADDEMKRAAQKYLHFFATGFRREEMERLSR